MIDNHLAEWERRSRKARELRDHGALPLGGVGAIEAVE